MEFFHRKYIRWHGYNYDTAGYYFITIVTHERKNILSRIEDNQVHLSLTSNPQLNFSTSFLRVHILSLLNLQIISVY
ncbi:Uncharacterised protein [Prevotella disiens]|uniref:Uncharacterized protein n=1 Tax=Prevotella disiens TaxID=28130 RepID=A0A379DXB4_9BACT|nr:Uncharacterised protein [Prevotella disiens]